VPAEWLEACQLVNDRTANSVELLGNRLGKCLLSYGVGVVDASLRCTGTRTSLNVLAARVLKEDLTLVLTDVSCPDVTCGRVLVRLTPRSCTGLTTEIVGYIRVDVGGVVGVHGW